MLYDERGGTGSKPCAGRKSPRHKNDYRRCDGGRSLGDRNRKRCCFSRRGRGDTQGRHHNEARQRRDRHRGGLQGRRFRAQRRENLRDRRQAGQYPAVQCSARSRQRRLLEARPLAQRRSERSRHAYLLRPRKRHIRRAGSQHK